MEYLTQAQVSTFIQEGFIKIDQAFPAEIAAACRAILWKATNCDPNDRSTWLESVVRIGELAQEPFLKAANTPKLISAFNQLVGIGNWLPRETLGSFPIRFPGKEPAKDTGWHVDASFPGEDASDYLSWRINVYSKGRALLMLFLFSDVEEPDAPTMLRVGSHIDVARILAPEGENGLSFMELAEQLNKLPNHNLALATGKAGTVYLCHPFMVHAAQDHQGLTPRFMAQPALLTRQDFTFNNTGSALYPVEKAILL